MDPTEPLAAVVGGNCKRIRTAASVTQDELARCARDLGLRWNSSKVADFESGRAAPTFATVLAASLALDHALAEAAHARDGSAERVTLADLVDCDGWVEVNDALGFRGGELADVCRGNVWPASPNRPRSDARIRVPVMRGSLDAGAAVALLRQRSGLAEQRLAQRLGVSRERLAGVSFQLWQRTFSDERDRRAGPDANRQKRGQVSRTLQSELEKVLNDGND